jgi:drug/metabolite transporter (DMT)-like permease
MQKAKRNYKLGAAYSVATAALLAMQHPFSALAATRLGGAEFICITQIVLLLSVPFLLRSEDSRRDFRTLITSATYLKQFAALLVIGLLGLLLYFVGLSKAHPVVVSAILNLSPFWAALVALYVAKKSIPTSWTLFYGCLAVAFVGAMMIAFSQIADAPSSLITSLREASLLGPWLYAVPVPILYALSGSLIGKWFAKFDDSACIAVTFTTGASVLIPATLVFSYVHGDLAANMAMTSAIVLLVIGTVLSASIGRLIYQISLTTTANDNGFVTMFFMLIPALTCLLSLAMAPWIKELQFSVGPMFFIGLALIALPMLLFSWRSWHGEQKAAAK